MHLKSRRRSQVGVVLIVVIGVLALLSLLAATFGMLMSVNLAASRNETEFETARQAALAGEEYVVNALQATPTGAGMTFGLPTFDPNPSDPFGGQFLYKRDGMKVYFSASPQTATVNGATVTLPWMLNLGPGANGMFNINAMGFAADLGDNCNPDIRYTSFDCSLVRLLTARFNPNYHPILNPNPGLSTATIAQIDALRGTGYPSLSNAYEQQRMAILLSRAIIAWRDGPEGVPGSVGTEERRLGHLPRWNSKLSVTTAYVPSGSTTTAYTNPPSCWNSGIETPVGDTNVNAGVLYPNANCLGVGTTTDPPYPSYSSFISISNTFDWGWGDGLPSRLTMICFPEPNPSYALNLAPNLDILLPYTSQWSFIEPGEWQSYTGGGIWNNDIGLPLPGLFYGKIYAGSSATSVIADNTQPGWRDWPANNWGGGGYWIYVATGPSKGAMAQIKANAANTLTLVGSGLAAIPNPGDAFCIFMPPTQESNGAFPPGSYDGVLSFRWTGNLTGTAKANYKYDVNSGDLVPSAMYWPNRAVASETLATETSVTDLLVDNNLLLAPSSYGLIANQGTVTSPAPGPTDSLLNDATKNWQTNALAGLVVHIYAGAGRGQVRTVQSNTATQLTIYNPVTNQPTFWTKNDPLADSTGNINPPTTATYQPSQYRIEWPDNNLPSKFQPNNLPGDNRLYLSLGSLRDSVIVPALSTGFAGIPSVPGDGLSATTAQSVADLLLPAFQPYLSVSTQAIQASQSLIGINDWAVDGVDNLGSGTVDSPGEATAATMILQGSLQGNAQHRPQQYIQSMYQKLGLKAWTQNAAIPSLDPTVAGDTVARRTEQAAQLLANIIDFADTGDVPTAISANADLNANLTKEATVYGAKGLHVTQIMPSPDPIYGGVNTKITPGGEMTDDGQNGPGGDNMLGNYLTDTHGWDFIPGSPGYWQVMEKDNSDNNPTATFLFPGLTPGYYSMRLIGSGKPFTLIYPPTTGTTTGTSYTVTPSQPDPQGGTWLTGFVRAPGPPANKCMAANNSMAVFYVPGGTAPGAGTLTFQLQAPVGAQFRGFALCAQYIQLNNISAHDILFTPVGIGTTTTYWTITTDQSAKYGVITIPQNYKRALDGKLIDISRIAGASTPNYGITNSTPVAPATGVFPVNYGTYVICMSEAAYENQWTAKKNDPDYSNTGGYNGALSTDGDGLWGDAPNEAYPIFPVGDPLTLAEASGGATTAATCDARAMALLMGAKGTTPTAYSPSVTVTNPAGYTIAGGPTLTPGGFVPNYVNGTYVDGQIPPIAATPLDPTYSNVLYCYSSIEKTVLLQPTWDIGTGAHIYWASCWHSSDAGGGPVYLAGYQNVLATVPNDPPRIPPPVPSIPTVTTMFRTCLNRNYNDPISIYAQIWQSAPVPAPPLAPPQVALSTNPTFMTPTSLVSQSRVFPIILNRPYPTTAWLGLVPTSNTDVINAYAGNPADPLHQPGSWRTIDPNPVPSQTVNGLQGTAEVTPLTAPEQLLGTVMSNATAGGVYARFNINTAPIDTLKSVFSDADAALIVATRNTRFTGQQTAAVGNPPALATASWANWDEFLNDPLFQYLIRGTATGGSATTLTAEAFRNWTPGSWPNPPPGSLRQKSGPSNRRHRRRTMRSHSKQHEQYADDLFQPNAAAWIRHHLPDHRQRIQLLRDSHGRNHNDDTYGYEPELDACSCLPPDLWSIAVILLTGGAGVGQYAVIQSNTSHYGNNLVHHDRRTSPPRTRSGSDSWTTSVSGISNADAGAGTYADGFPDSSNEKKEWFMRFSNLFNLQSTTFDFVVAGLVYKDQPWDSTNVNNNAPVAAARIEVDVDLSTGTPSIVNFRYLGQ